MHDSERLLNVRELADYLRLNERTVLKLAGQGQLPGARIGNQWRFRQRVIDAWLDDQMLGVRGPVLRPDPEELASFTVEQCLSVAQIAPDLQGVERAKALGELVQLAHQLELVRDPTWFLGALLERENVLTSAVGDGVAFPHTLHRHPEQIQRPFVIVGRSRPGVDFAAPDGQAVHLIILMGLRFQELHLPWLARLSALLRDHRARETLLTATSAEALHSHLLQQLTEPTSP